MWLNRSPSTVMPRRNPSNKKKLNRVKIYTSTRVKVEHKNELINKKAGEIMGVTHSNQTVAVKARGIKQKEAEAIIRHADGLMVATKDVEEVRLFTSLATKSSISRSPHTFKIITKSNTKNTQMSSTTATTPIIIPNIAITSNSRIITTNPNSTLTMAKSSTMNTNKITAQNTMSKSTLTNPELPRFHSLKPKIT